VQKVTKGRIDMQKMSLFAKCTIVAILITLVLSSFPTGNVVAKGNNTKLEEKWDQLVTNFNQQSAHHISVHHRVDRWFQTHDDATASEKTEVNKHLAVCNSALSAAGAIVTQHKGFDADGKVVDRAAAQKSVKDLAYYLRQHAGSVHNLQEHMN
jgi:hypothetical protein